MRTHFLSGCTKPYLLAAFVALGICGTAHAIVAQPVQPRNVYHVIGGGSSNVDVFPFAAQLFKEGEFVCGASILASRWIITAAHCVGEEVSISRGAGGTAVEDKEFRAFSSQLFTVVVGESHLALDSSSSEHWRVDAVHVLSSFAPDSGAGDIALLRLQRSLTFSDRVAPIAVNVQRVRERVPFTALGWGRTWSEGEVSHALRAVTLRTDDLDTCRNVHRDFTRADGPFVCTGEGNGNGTCFGDSGGPLVERHVSEQDGSVTWSLVGLTSFTRNALNPNTTGCGMPGTVGFFTRVAYFLPYVEHVTGLAKKRLVHTAA